MKGILTICANCGKKRRRPTKQQKIIWNPSGGSKRFLMMTGFDGKWYCFQAGCHKKGEDWLGSRK